MAAALVGGSIGGSEMTPREITDPAAGGGRTERSWLRAVPADGAAVAHYSAISILLADDHAFVRRSLRGVLDSDGELQVVGEAADLTTAMRQVQAQGPHVLILDVGVPAGSILGVIRDLRTRAREVLAAGASAYVLTDWAERDLGRAVRAAARGESFIAPELEQLIRVYESGSDGLSGRELEVLRLIGLGHTNSEIGGLLGLSVRTVESHRASIHRKLGLTTRAELVRYALSRGLLAAELASDARAR
jgi:two-component system response regulator NreC